MLPNDDVSQFRFVFHDPLLFEWVGAPVWASARRRQSRLRESLSPSESGKADR